MRNGTDWHQNSVSQENFEPAPIPRSVLRRRLDLSSKTSDVAVALKCRDEGAEVVAVARNLVGREELVRTARRYGVPIVSDPPFVARLLSAERTASEREFALAAERLKSVLDSGSACFR